MIWLLLTLETEEERNLLAAVYERYRHFLWYLANRILQDEVLAEDAVQETFVVLCRHIERIDSVESSRTRNFLATVVKSRAIDLLRARSRRAEEPMEDQPEAEAPAGDVLDEVLRRSERETIIRAIGQLDEKYRAVFVYKYLYELSDRVIADILEIEPKNVNVRMFRARKKLQELLTAMEVRP